MVNIDEKYIASTYADAESLKEGLIYIVNDEINKQKRDLEIETLQAQINPHFLYNTLNMIKWMAVEEKHPGLHIKISDTGAGIDEARLKEINDNLSDMSHNQQSDGKKHIGLTNVSRRIGLTFSDECLMTLENNLPKGITVTMMIQKEI